MLYILYILHVLYVHVYVCCAGCSYSKAGRSSKFQCPSQEQGWWITAVRRVWGYSCEGTAFFHCSKITKKDQKGIYVTKRIIQHSCLILLWLRWPTPFCSGDCSWEDTASQCGGIHWHSCTTATRGGRTCAREGVSRSTSSCWGHLLICYGWFACVAVVCDISFFHEPTGIINLQSLGFVPTQAFVFLTAL